MDIAGSQSGARDGAILTTDASVEGEQYAAALRALGYVVVDAPLSLLEARAIGGMPRVIIVDVDQHGAIDAVERLRELPAGAAAELVCVGDAMRAAELGVTRETERVFERPVDRERLVAVISRLADPPREGRMRATTPPPSYAPRRDTAAPPYVPSEPPGPPSDFPAISDAAELDPAAGGEGSFGPEGLAPVGVSPELEQLLREAEDRISLGSAPSDSGGEVDLLLSPEMLASLDDPLDSDDEDSAGGTGSTSNHGTGGTSGTGAQAKLGTAPGERAGALTTGAGTSPGMLPLSGTGVGTQPRFAQPPRADPASSAAGREPLLALAASTREGAQPTDASPDDGRPPRVAGREGTFADSSGDVAAEVARGDFSARTPAPAPIGEGASLLRGTNAGVLLRQRDEAPATEAFLRGGFFARGDELADPYDGAPPPSLGAPRTNVEIDEAPRDLPQEGPAAYPAASLMMDVASAAQISPPSLGRGPRLTGGVSGLDGPTHTEAPLPTVLGEGDALRALARAVSGRASGSLAFGPEPTIRRVVLREGDVVTAASSAPAETLVAFLVARGDLERDAGARLASRLPPYGRHAGAALIAHGHLGQDDLWPVLRAHAEWIIARAVTMEEGTCELESDPPGRLRAEPNVFGGATGAEVVVEIARRSLAPDVALRRLGGSRARLEAGPRAGLLGECALAPRDEPIVRGAVGKSVGEALAGHDPDVALLLYVLAALDVFEVLAPPRPATDVPRPGSDPLDEEALRQRVRARAALVQEGDYFALLGIARGATGYEIRRAYLELRRGFAVERILTAATADLADDVRLILEILDEAYDILREPARRERYRRAIEAGPP